MRISCVSGAMTIILDELQDLDEWMETGKRPEDVEFHNEKDGETNPKNTPRDLVRQIYDEVLNVKQAVGLFTEFLNNELKVGNRTPNEKKKLLELLYAQRKGSMK